MNLTLYLQRNIEKVIWLDLTKESSYNVINLYWGVFTHSREWRSPSIVKLDTSGQCTQVVNDLSFVGVVYVVLCIHIQGVC